jgi:hypothetical protein
VDTYGKVYKTPELNKPMRYLIGFTERTENEFYDSFQGKWVNITQPNKNFHNGLFRRIEDKHLVLNPHIGIISVDSESGPVKGLVEEDCYVAASEELDIEPTSRETLEKFCIYANKKREDSSKKGEDKNE